MSETPVYKADSYRVLVVDDNLASAKTLGWLLEILGHRVELALDAEEAIAKAKIQKPDVALLDIGMPGTNGYELCKLLRKEPALQHTIFIAQTGWGQEQHLQRARESGFDYHSDQNPSAPKCCNSSSTPSAKNPPPLRALKKRCSQPLRQPCSQRQEK